MLVASRYPVVYASERSHVGRIRRDDWDVSLREGIFTGEEDQEGRPYLKMIVFPTVVNQTTKLF